MGLLDIELVYDATPGARRREYFQSFIPDETFSLVPGRNVNCSTVVALLHALEGHPERDRLMRAINQYNLALEFWSPGSEVLCLSHLFMGVEALKRVAWRQLVSDREIRDTELGQEWGYREDGRRAIEDFLDQEVRRRILFNSDDGTHRIAKRISDDVEHGFHNFGALRPIASSVVVKTSGYLRNAIILLSKVGTDASRILLAHPFDKPRGPLKLIKYLRGSLVADADDLAAEGQTYPICAWKSSLDRVSRNDAGEYGFAPREEFKTNFAEGVNFNPERFEVWDGSVIHEVQRPQA